MLNKSNNDENWRSCFLPSSFSFSESLKVFLINMVAFLMMSAKLATLGLLKIKYFEIKVMTSNYIIDVVMWPKFGNPRISMKEDIRTSVIRIWLEKNFFFFEESSWFNHLKLALGITLKFYTSVEKELKLQVRKFSGLIPTFVEVTG